MKFKLLSLALLLVCFAFLGVLTGVIPVMGPDDGAALSLPAAATASAAVATDEPAVSPRAITPPTPRLAGTAAPEPTGVIMGPTAAPAAAGTNTPVPVFAGSSDTPAPTRPLAQTPAPVQTPAPSVPAVPLASAEPEHTAGPGPTAAPEPTPAPADTSSGWEPDVAVVSTTITWNDPLQNDTDIALDGRALLEKEPQIVLPAEGAQILIIHTHGTEAYTPDGEDRYEATADYRTTDTAHTVVRVGEALGKALESYGLRVIVDTGLYDWPSYNGSYSRAEEAIQRYLAEDPGIAMIIDLHRDALGDDTMVYKTVSDALAEPVAQMMFVVGTDENLDHPHWRDNLALAVSLQGLVEDEYPHLMRPTLVCPYRYNQQYTTGSVLLEIGTAGNTLQEAIAAAELFADAVGPVLAERVGA